MFNYKKKVEKLESYIDDADAYERRDTVILSGSALPAATIGENCNEVTRQILKRELNMEIPLTEINTCHRLGKKSPSQSPDTRPIIVKLCRRDVKSQLISAARQLGKGNSKRGQNIPNLFVNESLTPPRRKILFTLRQIKRAHPDIVSGCSSYDGKIFAYTKNGNLRNTRHLVNNHQSLVKFCDEHIKVPIQTFLDHWEF